MADLIVSVEAPVKAMVGDEFDVPIKLTGDVVDLAGCNFNINVDKTLIEVTSISDGEIGGQALPVYLYTEPVPGQYRVLLFNLPMVALSGTGILATLKCKANTAGVADIDISDGVLGDINAAEIPATWEGDSITFFRLFDLIAAVILGDQAFTLDADVNGDSKVNVLDLIAEQILVQES